LRGKDGLDEEVIITRVDLTCRKDQTKTKKQNGKKEGYGRWLILLLDIPEQHHLSS
jgi:hypothetical protein